MMAMAEGEIPHATSAPIPIPNTQPTELHELISAKRWPAAIDRCQAHPHEVGSSSHLRNERGYTALHTLMAYSHSTPGGDLVPLVKAILRAADEINYGAEFRLGRGEEGSREAEDECKINTNEIVEGEGEPTQVRLVGGSWRLLLDQNNRARWSPLHLICVHGGITHGKIAVIKALLQMDVDENDGGELNQYRQRIITLLDRQNRNILHHLLDIVVPSDIEAVGFAVALTPSLLFQQDNREKTPLQYVLERIMANPGSRRRHYMNSYGNDDAGLKKNYQMLSLLVRCMEQETRGWGAVKNIENAASLVPEEDQTTSCDEISRNIPRNVLQSASLLPRSLCPSDGSLLTYLSSDTVSTLEAKVRADAKFPVINMAEETTCQGNLALHLFVSNESYAGDSDSNASDQDANNDTSNSSAEDKILDALLDKNRSAVRTANSNDELPLHIAMKAGRRRAVATLLVEYPEAVLLYDSFDNIKLIMHILSSISVAKECGHEDASSENKFRYLTTMFALVRARPDIVSLAGSSRPEPESKKEESRGGLFKTKKWWKNLNPFSQNA